MNTKNKKIELTREEERELILKYQETNEEQYLVKLIEAHTPYIQKIAAREFQKYGKRVEYEDLVQEGKIGLVKAIKKFQLNRESINPNTNTVVKNQALLTYAHSWIRSEMQTLSHHSNSTNIPVHIQRSMYCKVKDQGNNAEELKELAKQAMKAESLDAIYSGESSADGEKRNAKISEEFMGKDPTFDYASSHILSPMIQNALTKLNEEETIVLKMRLGLDEDGMVAKTKYIAEYLGISEEQVDKSFKRAKRILQKQLKPSQKMLLGV